MKQNENASGYFVRNADENDLPLIYQLFEEAIAFQKENNYQGWNGYDKAFIQEDIRNKHLFVVEQEGNVICIFSICFTDQLIWREKEKGDALYLHRVVLNRKFGRIKIFQFILQWSKAYAQEHGLKLLRMDTWAGNEKLIGYYKSYGFRFVEEYTTADTDALPLQHRNLQVALLEYDLQQEETSSNEKVSIDKVFLNIPDYWNQKIIGQANGQLIKLARGRGEVNWHKHDDQDEVFILYKGHLTIQLRDRNVELFEHDMFIVPKGVEHRPKAHGDTAFLIMGLNITSNAAGGRPERLN